MIPSHYSSHFGLLKLIRVIDAIKSVNSASCFQSVCAFFATLIFILFFSSQANANQLNQSFVVEDIRIDGLIRISPSVVLNSIDLKIGDQFENTNSKEIIEQLFESDYFDDVIIGVDGSVVVISLVERPILLAIEISGNDQLKDEDLLQSLRLMGLVKGQSISKALLNQVETEIQLAYQSIGHYRADVQLETFPESRNRVMIRLSINENEKTKITNIEIIGNNFFSQKRLLAQMSLDTGGIFSFITDSNVFTDAKFNADIEQLNSFYLNQGFADFKITNREVNLSADKKEISLLIEMDEGMQYSIGTTSFDLISEFKDLAETTEYQVGDIFNYQLIEDSSFSISQYLAEFGYAFARVTPRVDLNRDQLVANIHYEIQPNEKMYVNRINISGNVSTNDRVIRRELDILEGSVFNKNKLDSSVRNLNRLGYFEDINIDFEPTRGKINQVDLQVEVSETLTGNYSFGIAYSDESGVGTSFGIRERNFLGAGYVVNADVSYSQSTQEFSVSVTDPFFTENRQSITAGLFYSKFDADELDNSSNYQIDRIGANIGYGIPLSELDNNRINLNLRYSENDLTCGSALLLDDINGEKTQCQDYQSSEIYSVAVSWSKDTKDAFFFPSQGYENLLSLTVNLPFSTLNEYIIRNTAAYYIPVVLNTNTYVFKSGYNISYVDSYDGQDVAFYNRYYLGGSRTLRGFQANSLGPKYQNNQVKGGTFRVSGNFSLIFEPPFIENSEDMRLAPFIDYGYVYEDIGSVNLADIRASAGVAFSWLTAIGPLTFSWASPIIKQQEDTADQFQFTLGTAF